MDYLVKLAQHHEAQRLERAFQAQRRERDMIKFTKWFCWLTLFVGIIAFALIGQAHAVEIDIDKIIQIESSGNPDAYNSRSGCIGLMQINPKAALLDYNYYHGKKYFAQDLYNPQINVLIGQWYLSHRIPTMLKHYEIPITIETIIASYNWGIGHVRRWHDRGMVFAELPPETQNYIKKYRGLK